MRKSGLMLNLSCNVEPPRVCANEAPPGAELGLTSWAQVQNQRVELARSGLSVVHG